MYVCVGDFKGEQGEHAGQTQVDFLSDTISSSFVAAVRQMVPPGSSFNTHTCASRHTSTHTPACSVRDHTSFHYPSSVLYNNIRWGNNRMLSLNISSGISARTVEQRCQVSSFIVKLSPAFPLRCRHHLQSNNTWYFWLNQNQLHSVWWHQWWKVAINVPEVNCIVPYVQKPVSKGMQMKRNSNQQRVLMLRFTLYLLRSQYEIHILCYNIAFKSLKAQGSSASALKQYTCYWV